MALTKISTAMWNSVPHHDTHDFNVDDVLYVDVSANKVGIGTANPTSKLSIEGSNSGSVPLVNLVASGTGAFQRGVRLLNSGMNAGDHLMYAVGQADGTKNMGQFYFYYAGSGSNSNRISMGLHSVDDVFNILGTGKVGIGTTSPSADFQVKPSTGAGQGGAIALSREGNRSTLQAYYVINSDSYGDELYMGVGANSSDVSIGARHGSISFQTGAYAERLNINTSGNVVATVDMRAPIFYDSDNTSYYVNPDSTSKSAHLRGLVEIINETPKLVLNDFNATTTTNQTGWVSFQINGTESGWVGYGSSGTSHLYLYNTNGIIYNYGSYTLHENSSRAPIFYDSDDTNYYLDPASTSRINTINYTQLKNAADTGYGIVGNNAYFDTVNSGLANDPLELVYVTGTEVRIGDSGGNKPIKASVFYKGTNTSYYVDPNSVSVLEAGRFGLTAGSWGSVYIATNTNAGWGTAAFPHIGSTGGSAGSLIMLHNPHIPFRTDNARSGATGRSGIRCAIDTSASAWWDIGLYGDAFEIYRGASSQQMFHVDNARNSYSWGSSRAPIFYDSDNTGYYLNPQSFSNLGSIKLNEVISSSDVGDARIGRNYAYNTLELKGYGAEMMIGAGNTALHINYRYCNNTANTSQTPQDWYWKAGTSTTYSNHYWGNGYGLSSLRAPIFYDHDNTSYYIDPNSTSSLVNIAMDGELRLHSHGSTKFYRGSGDAADYNNQNVVLAGWNGLGLYNPTTGGVFPNQTSGFYDFRNGIFDVKGSFRAPIFYDSNNTGYYLNPNGYSQLNRINADGLSAYQTVIAPYGGDYTTSSSTQTGAIKVTLPHSWTNTMLRMTIKVYQYSTNQSFEVHCGGYNYAPGSTWVNPFAYIIANPGVDKNFNVRFGHDGSKCCIYIGETNSTWSYMQIVVTDVKLGYSYYAASDWDSGWDVGFATSFGAITQTLSNSQVGRIADVIYDSTNTAYYLDPSSTGDSLRVAGDIVAYYSSDRRLKDNIIKIDSALDKVNAIGGYTFDWNEEAHKQTGSKDVGVIAQEVEEIFPEIVQTRSNGYKAVNYEKLVPLLIEAIKELSEKVKILENK